MARIDAYTPGQFSWVDLMSPDAQASTRFYGSLFGWSHQAQQDQHGAIYTMFTRGGLNVCGMGEMSPELKQTGMPPMWSSYVTVEDAAATVARCRELGGQVQLDVISITDAGKMAILVDPSGAHISVWEPGAHIGAQIVNEPGTFCWNELTTRDVEEARRFYGELFGWSIRPSQEGSEYWEIHCGERENGGILPWQPHMGDMPPAWTVYFAVEDCDASVKQLQELGGNLFAGPMDIPPGRFAVVSDAQGGVFNVIAMHAPD